MREVERFWVVRDALIDCDNAPTLRDFCCDLDEGLGLRTLVHLYVGTYQIDPERWERERTKVYVTREDARAEATARLQAATAEWATMQGGGTR